MKSVLSSKHNVISSLLIIISILFSFEVINADPSNGVVYHSVLFGKALALDATKDKLYLAIDSTENLYIYDLDSNGNPLASPSQINDGDNGKALALDSQNQLLYLAGSSAGDSLIVFNLDSDGNTIAPSTHFTNFAFDALAIALNPTEQRLYLGLDGGTNSLGVYQTNGSGMPLTSPMPTTSNSGGTVHALVVDAVQQKLYMGTSGAIRVFNLDSNGDPTGVYTSFTAGSNDIDTIALDSMKHRLYAASSSANTVYTFTLDASGEPQASPGTYDAGSTVYSLGLDATRQIMYIGSSSDLRWFSLDGNGDPTGVVSTISSGSQVRSVAIDAKRQRLYTASFTNSTYFQLTDQPMKPLLVENGAASVTQQDVTMQWKLPNAKYIMVESSSNLVDFYFPVTYTANTIFDQWIAATGDRWSNTVSVRANTLTVNATLSSGTGTKTINIWFWESSGASNDNGVIRRESVTVNLSVGGSPTHTPTISPTPSWTQTHSPTWTPSMTPTASPTPTWTLTASPTPSPTPSWTTTVTLSPSPTPSWTLTASPTPSNTPSITPTDSPTVSPTMTWTPTTSPTPTWTATIDLSWTPTPTSTASPTLTYSPTPTYTFTVTPTGTPTLTPTPSGTETPIVTYTPTITVTRTGTITPTVTITSTITVTIPPTATPLPSPEFHINKNKFNPKKESLQIHFGLKPNEKADLSIYSLTGRKIWEISNSHFGQLFVDVQWDGKNKSNDWVASGVYFIVLKTEKRKEIKKVLVVK